jgi:hypothetical protein
MNVISEGIMDFSIQLHLPEAVLAFLNNNSIVGPGSQRVNIFDAKNGNAVTFIEVPAIW